MSMKAETGDASRSHGTPRLPAEPPKRRRGLERILHCGLRGASPARTSMLGLWPPELAEDHVSCLNHSACGAFPQRPGAQRRLRGWGPGSCQGSQGRPGNSQGGMLGSGENRPPRLGASVVSHPAIVPLDIKSPERTKVMAAVSKKGACKHPRCPPSRKRSAAHARMLSA